MAGIKCSHCDKPGCDYPHSKTCPDCRQRFCRDHADSRKHMCPGKQAEEEESIKAPFH